VPHPRIAFWSPLPPQKTGIADYSVELLDALTEIAEVEVFVDDAYVPDIDLYRRFTLLPAALYERRSAHTPFDLNVYHVGNNAAFNGWIYDRALKTPGLVVLHDLSLADMHYERLYKNGSATIFLDEVEAMHGLAVRATAMDVMSDPDRRGWVNLAMSERLVENGLGLIVHSAWAETFLRARHENLPIYHVMQPAPLLDTSAEMQDAMRQRYGLPAHGLVVGVFGGVARRKRMHAAIEAFAQFHTEHPDARMVLLGRAEDRDYVDQLQTLVRNKGLDRVVRFHGEASSVGEFGRLLQAVDLIVNLRWPTNGETSAVMMRAFAAGKVVVTSNVPQFQEYPDDFCWRAPVDVSDADEQAAVLALLRRAAADRLGLRRGGEAARHYMEEHATWSRTAARYVEIGEIVRNRAPFIISSAPDDAEEEERDMARSRHRALLEQWEAVRRASEKTLAPGSSRVSRLLRRSPAAPLVRLYRRVRLLGQLSEAQAALNWRALDENERLRNEILQLQIERLVALKAQATAPAAPAAGTSQRAHAGANHWQD